MRRIVWIAPWLIATCFSCTNSGDTVTTPEVLKTPDIVREDDGFTSSFYDSDNPYTARQVNEAGEHDVVRATVDDFESLGYTRALEYSFVAEGVDPNGERVEIIAVAMSSPSGTAGDAVYVFYIRGEGYEVAIPLRVAFDDDPPDGDFQRIGEGVWLGFAEEPLGAGGVESSARFYWSPWLRCVGERIAAGAASCAVTCSFTFNFYIPCLVKCTAGYAMYAMLYCAFTQL